MELEVRLKEAECTLQEREVELEKLGEDVEEEGEWRRQEQVHCGELQGRLDVLTQENHALRASHQNEVSGGVRGEGEPPAAVYLSTGHT